VLGCALVVVLTVCVQCFYIDPTLAVSSTVRVARCDFVEVTVIAHREFSVTSSCHVPHGEKQTPLDQFAFAVNVVAALSLPECVTQAHSHALSPETLGDVQLGSREWACAASITVPTTCTVTRTEKVCVDGPNPTCQEIEVLRSGSSSFINHDISSVAVSYRLRLIDRPQQLTTLLQRERCFDATCIEHFKQRYATNSAICYHIPPTDSAPAFVTPSDPFVGGVSLARFCQFLLLAAGIFSVLA
jgi:hypothetical protein